MGARILDPCGGDGNRQTIFGLFSIFQKAVALISQSLIMYFEALFCFLEGFRL